MRKGLPYTGRADSQHPFEVSLVYRRWPLLFSDQWFLPGFKVSVKNLGTRVARGSINVEITDFENVKELSQVSTCAGPFQGVHVQQISDLLPGQEEKFKFVIESRYLHPGQYIVRMTFTEWIPSESPIKELASQLEAANASEQGKAQAIGLAEQFFRNQGVDPYVRPQNQYKGKQLFDFRFVERIKIHSLTSAATVMGVFIGTIVGTCGGFLYATARIVYHHWQAIRIFFR